MLSVLDYTKLQPLHDDEGGIEGATIRKTPLKLVA